MIEVVDEEPSGGECFEAGITYFSHCEVGREDKSSTKLLIVYSASVKGKHGVSLNDCLYKRSYMSPMLYDLFLMSQTHPIAITTDIVKAFLQISIKQRHRNLLRFLWFDNQFEKPPSIVKMRFCRVIVGATCPQHLLTSTIQRHGDKFCRKVKSHFYVGDVDSGILLHRNMKDRFFRCQLQHP